MNRKILLFGMLLFISIFSAPKMSDNVILFPTDASFDEHEFGIVAVSHFLTLTEIDDIAIKVSGERVKLAPGKHIFKIKDKKNCPLGLCSQKKLSINIEPDKIYLIRVFDTKVDSRTYKTTYEIKETTEEFLEEYGAKKK